MAEEIRSHDHRERRCPMLGHPVPFSYCRTVQIDLPCRKIIDCWWEEFDVTSYCRTVWDEEAIRQAFSPPKPKVLSLLELIEEARQGRKGGAGQSGD